MTLLDRINKKIKEGTDALLRDTPVFTPVGGSAADVNTVPGQAVQTGFEDIPNPVTGFGIAGIAKRGLREVADEAPNILGGRSGIGLEKSIPGKPDLWRVLDEAHELFIRSPGLKEKTTAQTARETMSFKELQSLGKPEVIQKTLNALGKLNKSKLKWLIPLSIWGSFDNVAFWAGNMATNAKKNFDDGVINQTVALEQIADARLILDAARIPLLNGAIPFFGQSIKFAEAGINQNEEFIKAGKNFATRAAESRQTPEEAAEVQAAKDAQFNADLEARQNPLLNESLIALSAIENRLIQKFGLTGTKQDFDNAIMRNPDDLDIQDLLKARNAVRIAAHTRPPPKPVEPRLTPELQAAAGKTRPPPTAPRRPTDIITNQDFLRDVGTKNLQELLRRRGKR